MSFRLSLATLADAALAASDPSPPTYPRYTVAGRLARFDVAESSAASQEPLFPPWQPPEPADQAHATIVSRSDGEDQDEKMNSFHPIRDTDDTYIDPYSNLSRSCQDVLGNDDDDAALEARLSPVRLTRTAAVSLCPHCRPCFYHSMMAEAVRPLRFVPSLDRPGCMVGAPLRQPTLVRQETCSKIGAQNPV